jgi:hypothetical protein
VIESDRTRVRRVPYRACYDRATIDAILDAALIAHVGFVGANQQPFVIPMAVARDGDLLLLHGSTASRLMRTIAGGADVCVTVTHLDGVVVSRSVFDSSMNYRSVVVLGRARPIADRTEKLAALHALVDHLIPGRWDEARPPSEQELKATLVLALPIDEASAKIRTGPPRDDETDVALPFWAGEIPLTTVALEPVVDRLVPTGLEVPPSVRSFIDRRGPARQWRLAGGLAATALSQDEGEM